jgi:hypothetical protein
MAAPLIAGGSANITLDLAQGGNWELNGLDANGKVLQSVNVKIKTNGLVTTINLTLPTIASLNNRNVVFNIDTNDFGGSVVLIAGSGNLINGEATLTTAYANFSVVPVSSTSSVNWTLPVIQEAP